MTPEEQAQHDAETERQLRDLAAQIAAMTKLPFDPVTVRKAVVVGVADTATPPTVSLNISGDSTTTVSEVRTLNNYTPLVGQTVLLAKQGAEIFILGAIASVNPKLNTTTTTEDNGWIKATLTNGSHDGASFNGEVYYRKVLDHGSWKMQWRGGWVTGGSTTMIGSGDALDPEYRPTTQRSVITTRNSDGSVYHRIDFKADGTVTIIGGTPRIPETSSIGGSTGGTNTWTGEAENTTTPYSGVGYGPDGHQHTIGHTHPMNHSHSITTNAHSHGGYTEIGDPTWISLNVEYFL